MHFPVRIPENKGIHSLKAQKPFSDAPLQDVGAITTALTLSALFNGKRLNKKTPVPKIAKNNKETDKNFFIKLIY
jgi:hypothetical protein